MSKQKAIFKERKKVLKLKANKKFLNDTDVNILLMIGTTLRKFAENNDSISVNNFIDCVENKENPMEKLQEFNDKISNVGRDFIWLANNKNNKLEAEKYDRLYKLAFNWLENNLDKIHK